MTRPPKHIAIFNRTYRRVMLANHPVAAPAAFVTLSLGVAVIFVAVLFDPHPWTLKIGAVLSMGGIFWMGGLTHLCRHWNEPGRCPFCGYELPAGHRCPECGRLHGATE